MLIREASSDLDAERELKVKIPVYLHVRLRSVKILHGDRMSDVVTRALAAYFAREARGDVATERTTTVPSA